MEKAVVSIVLSTLRDFLLEEARFLYGVSSEVKGLQTQLKEIQCLLEDADKRKHESKSIRNWMTEIRDLAYRSQDVIETYAFHVSLNRRRKGLKLLLRRFSCILNEGYSLHQIGSEILEIKSEIARVTKSMQKYGIRSIIQGESSTAEPSDNQQWKRQTFPFETEDCFVGKDDELKQLVSLIVEDEQPRIVAVWGMGGIGKTTIARKVYNHTDTKSYFKSFAWVCITQQCQIRSVLEDVLKQLNPQERNISSLSKTELIEQLCHIQKTKRCIVVLDDIWEMDHWDGLKHAFLIEGLKSKILLTTRKRNIANMGLAVELGLLNIDAGWELLKKKASPQSNFPDFSIQEKLLQKIGKEMVRKCGYLPLAISLLGGVLRQRNSVKDWESVNENINTYLYRGDSTEKENEIHGVLNLSYEDLPYYLKPCFLYMDLFREYTDVGVHVLYQLWIAEGMISQENQGMEETLMDIAEFYLSELSSRCIIEVELEDVIRGEKYRSCKLHDVMRELCLSMGKKEEFGFKHLDYQGGNFSTLLHESLSGTKTRHLTIYFQREMGSDDEFTITHDEDTSKHVRSLLVSNCIHRKTIEFPHTIIDFGKFKLLRELILVRFNFPRRKLLRGIDNLIHLRYLKLGQCELDELPSSISNLVYLSTLDLAYSRNVRLPNAIKKMCRLKHLVLPDYDLEKIGDYKLKFEGLHELETLLGFDSSLHDLKSITRMKKLRWFNASIRDNQSLSTIINVITTNWKDLRDCGVTIKQGCQFTSTQEGLMILKEVLACSYLIYLKIDVQLGRLLEECENQIITSKFVYLSLFECEINNDPMKILEKLPSLERLFLLKRSFVGEEMTCRALGFPRLKELVLEGLPNLKVWRVEEGAMPLLSKIEIKYYSCLEKVPDGLRFIGTLQRLTITGMPDLAKRVLASEDDGGEGEDFDIVRHVPSIVIYDD